MNKLSGGVAVITGAAGGLGEGIARAVAARGMKLVLADIAERPLQALAEELAASGVEAIAVPTNVADPAALDRLAAITIERFGDVRMLVNNAGIELVGNCWDLSADQWERIVRINLLGPIHGVRAFGRHMVAARQPAFIVNVSSLGGLGMMPMQTPYILTKHGVLSFTECLRLEMQRAAPMIQVSAVLPGPVATGIFDDKRNCEAATGSEALLATMQNIVSAGMRPREAADMIIDQVLEGKFWVSPHSEALVATAGQRGEYLSSLSDPQLNPEMVGLLDSLGG